jgi:6-phosphogluconolactonase
MSSRLHTFDTRDALHESLSQQIASRLRLAIKEQGVAALAVSGGLTPKPLFAALSRIDLPWEKVVVTLVDERWVRSDHPDSNEKLVREHLLIGPAAAATLLPLKNSATDPFDGTRKCCESIGAIGKTLDVVVLGMGSDGHTASFFPHDENLTHALRTSDLCAATIPRDAPHQRITLSLQTILQASCLLMHIEGEAKRAVYERALEAGRVEEMPVRAVLQSDHTVEVYYAD